MDFDKTSFESPKKGASSGTKNDQSSSTLKEKALEASKNIPGWLTDKEAGELFDLVSNIPSDNPICCEIGSYMGKSSIVLGMALLAKKGGKVFCIDPFDLISDYYEQVSKEEIGSESVTRKQFVMDNIRRYGLEEKIELIQGFSFFVARDFHQPLDFIFIDGDHGFEGVLEDYFDWSAILKVGGVIAFHDYYKIDDFKRFNPESYGPARVVDEYVRSTPGWATQKIIDDLFVAEKLMEQNFEIGFSNGWHKTESWNDITTHWAYSDAFLLVNRNIDQILNLKFNVMSFYRPRTLEIYSGDLVLGRWSVPTDFVEISQVAIVPGSRVLRLHVVEGCERPCDHPELNNPDTRSLSLAVQNVSLSSTKDKSSVMSSMVSEAKKIGTKFSRAG
jgi:predicted O-methyltransferase YrrM